MLFYYEQKLIVYYLSNLNLRKTLTNSNSANMININILILKFSIKCTRKSLPFVYGMQLCSGWLT